MGEFVPVSFCSTNMWGISGGQHLGCCAANRLGQPGDFQAVGAAQLVAQGRDVELLGRGVVRHIELGPGRWAGLDRCAGDRL